MKRYFVLLALLASHAYADVNVSFTGPQADQLQAQFLGNTTSQYQSTVSTNVVSVVVTGIKCISDGNCSAPQPACESISVGIDNCGNTCTLTGGPCPCVPDGSCSAPTPACDQTTTGIDNCGNGCSRTGPVCPPISTKDGPAELPRVYLDTTYPDVSGYVVKKVCASGCNYTNSQLQLALNNIRTDGGDVNGEVLLLQSGWTYTGNFNLPKLTMLSGKWVIVRTDTPDASLPSQGTRINPSYAPVLAKILSPNSAPAITVVSSANHYWLMGLEIGVTPTSKLNYSIISAGDGTQTSTTTLPSYIFVDRCYVHGNDTGDIKRGFQTNGIAMAAVDSYFSNIHVIGQDTQAISSWNGPGPFKFVNNYLEAACENILIGGSDAKIQNLVASDIEIRNNYFFKPLSWFSKSADYAGKPWSVKNLFELKNAQRVLLEGNVLENSWGGFSQDGYAIVLTPRNQNGTNPWSTVADVTIRYNYSLHSGGGINISGADDHNKSESSFRFSIHDNIFEDVSSGAWNGSGRLYQALSGGPTSNLAPPTDIAINHNTGFLTNMVFSMGDSINSKIVGLDFKNNIQSYGQYGVFGSGKGSGSSSLNAYCLNPVFKSNVLAIPPSGFNANTYPPGNFFPTNWNAVGFVDMANGNFRLKATSPYAGAGTDGKDIGANVDAVYAATCSAIAGIPGICQVP